MSKWIKPVGLAHKKKMGWVGISNPSTRCNPVRLTRQFSGPKRASPS